jgi:hypothetical protein
LERGGELVPVRARNLERGEAITTNLRDSKIVNSRTQDEALLLRKERPKQIMKKRQQISSVRRGKSK